jgi:predicted esterase
MRKLRILCLHGYCGSAKTLQMQMRPITRVLEPLAELVCVDAPSLAIGDFGWWHAVSNDGGDPTHAGVGRSTMRYKGWSKTKNWLVSLFQQRAPFDGVFGFSQGAALTSLLVGLRNPREAEASISFDFAMMVGGFASNDSRHTELYQRKEKYGLPSAHIIGESDFVVPSSRSDHLAGLFKDPLILRHSGGHVVPGDPPHTGKCRRLPARKSARGRPDITATLMVGTADRSALRAADPPLPTLVSPSRNQNGGPRPAAAQSASPRCLASIIQKAPQLPAPARMLELAQRLGLDLADALARHRELLADLLQRVVGVHADAEAHAQHAFFARRQ